MIWTTYPATVRTADEFPTVNDIVRGCGSFFITQLQLKAPLTPLSARTMPASNLRRSFSVLLAFISCAHRPRDVVTAAYNDYPSLDISSRGTLTENLEQKFLCCSGKLTITTQNPNIYYVLSEKVQCHNKNSYANIVKINTCLKELCILYIFPANTVKIETVLE